MAVEIPRSLVEYILLGPTSGRRQLQDSPILTDVWIAFARTPEARLDLLITPLRDKMAGEVAVAINRAMTDRSPDTDIGYLQGLVVARLDFEDVLHVVVPMTEWWHNPRNTDGLKKYTQASDGRARLTETIDLLLPIARDWKGGEPMEREPGLLSAVDRYLVLASLILWARAWSRQNAEAAGASLAAALKDAKAATLSDLLGRVFADIAARTFDTLVWQVSLNRPAMPAISRSIPAVKADAAKTLFAVRCKDIAWAVLDSGIQSDHPAFRDEQGTSRIKKTLDFSQFRQIVSLSNKHETQRKKNLEALAARRPNLPLETADRVLRQLAQEAEDGLPVNWDRVGELVEVKPSELPLALTSDHGTHVAGIIGASRKGAETASREAPEAETREAPGAEWVDGMCPDIALYDFRVLGQSLRDTEFAVIAALQYIRHLNARKMYTSIHGANLSLSIPHDVRNYACGRTPICVECERLVDSGVVVVAAAGNRGYQAFETKDGSYEGYAAFSVTDPGNADGVITVGATHRYSPHTYGVSFFSSRGPTGDGRAKPDLVAPGERINAPVLGGEWGDHDGTSMAAPHVSGAAAMLMARYSELIGEPRRVKRILCESATDLGREKSFQGHGMLDVLRAFQSV
ncbi:MAG: S8 family peptidase [Candidatus Rokuibacteriota bacterium]